MDQTFQPLEPAQPPPVVSAAVESRPNGLRRVVLTGAISALLLVGGGVAAVSAASPAPSTAPGTTAPGAGGAGPHGGSTANCPNMGGSSGSGGLELRQLGARPRPRRRSLARSLGGSLRGSSG